MTQIGTDLSLTFSFVLSYLPPIENSGRDKKWKKGQGNESAARKKQTQTTEVKRETDPGLSEGVSVILLFYIAPSYKVVTLLKESVFLNKSLDWIIQWLAQ